MKIDLVFSLIGGLGFFFFGMRILSEGLKKIAGDRLKSILYKVTKLPIVGVMIGAAVTLLIQSSSATTVMVVGFVNAGLLVLKQAICVIIGANIGTTFTAWLVSSMSVFKVSQYALPCVGIGFATMTFAKSRKIKSCGRVLMGFGILFIGLDFMKDAFVPLKESQQIKDVFAMLSENPLLGVLVGTVFTVILQSSSATIAIVQVLAFNGVISFAAAIPIILGDNIGTTITAQLAAVGANITARRAAMSHTLFNVIGVAYMMALVYTGWFAKAINFIIPGGITLNNVMFHIAVAHSAFNVVNAVVFLPLIGFLEKASIWLVPQKRGAVDIEPQYLEEHLLETPPLAMQQARDESVYMLNVAAKSVFCSAVSFIEGDPMMLEKVSKYERITDNLQSEITQYLIDLSQRELSKKQSQEIPVLIHNVNDIERIADHSENISELTRTRIEEKLTFTKETTKELNLIWDELNMMIKETQEALKKNDTEVANSVLVREKRINEFHINFKESHVKRLKQGEYNIESNFAFLDFVDNIEKIADHLTNIAQGVVGKMQWAAHK